MPFDTSIRFPCGDYKPGQAPRSPTGIPPRSPGSYAAAGLEPDPLFPTNGGSGQTPTSPPGPSSPGVGSPGGPATPGGGGSTPSSPPVIGGSPPARGDTTPTGPATGRPAGGTTTGPGGPTTGGPGTTPYTGPGDTTGGGRRGPVTPRGLVTRYKCMGTVPTYCSDGRTINGYRIRCGPCERDRYMSESAWLNDCRYLSAQACESSLHSPPCISSRTTPDPCVSITTTTNESSVTPPRIQQNTALNSNQVINTNQVVSYNQQNLNLKSVRSVTVNTNRFKGYSSASGYEDAWAGPYDVYYNFFKTTPNSETKLVSNNSYLNIFKTLISSEVKYFLDKMNTTTSWHEVDIHNLTKEKISISLRDDLLTAISNIHTVGNKKVSSDVFLESIRKHLMEGTLGEFDPNYYIYTYNNQVYDDVYEFNESGETPNTLDAAFAIFEDLSINPDYTTPGTDKTNEYKRMRFLLDDIEAELPVQQFEGYEYGIPLNTVGVPVQLVTEPSYINPVSGADLKIGDGAGYYFSTLNYDGTEYPIMSVNELSSAYYLTPNDRYNVLRLLGKEGELRLTVSSLPNNHEFSSSFNFSADVTPMYFALSAKSLGDVPNPNSVINIISGIYVRLTDEEAIGHSRNYSFNVIRANIDYRDLFIHYARDTSSFYYEQDDFDLRAFDINRSVQRFKIMTRTVPEAIILTPGCGSRHSPFNGKSKIIDFGGTSIVRQLNLKPTIDYQDNLVEKPFLDKSNIYNTLGTDYFGLYEKYLNTDIHGDIFTYNPSSEYFNNSYYYSGNYTNVQPPSSVRGPTPEAKLMNLAEKLTGLEGVEELTWWDVFRRLTINDVGSLMYTNNKPLIKELSLGYKNNVPIKPVLARPYVTPTGIPEGTEIADDTIIVDITNRYTDAKNN